MKKWIIGIALLVCWMFAWMYITKAEAAEFGVGMLTTDVSIECTANAESDLFVYKVYRSATPGVYGEAELVGTSSTPQLTDAGVGDGEWFWVVTATDTAGNEGGPSVEMTAILDTDPPAPPQGCTIVPAIIVPLILD